MTWLTLTLAVLATYRLTRLVTADFITERLRGWAMARSPWLGYLAGCDWCLSIWIAPLPSVAVILWGDNRAVFGVLLALALSAGTGLLATLERRLGE